MLTQTVERKRAFEILPADILNRLSPSAARLYAVIYNQMQLRQSLEIAAVNKEMARRSHISVGQVCRHQDELVKAGLLEMEFDSRDGFALAAQRVVYRWPQAAEQDAA